ncbi:MAG TPA: hypothetical protein VGL26_00120 [Jatrophihabitans sp.]|jgi:hypothetical protein
MSTSPTSPTFPIVTSSSSSLSSSALKHAVSTGRLVRLRRGLYVPADIWDEDDSNPDALRKRHCLRAHAATLAMRNAFASHHSAAALAGLPLWRPLPETPCITLPRRSQSVGPDFHLHRALAPARHIQQGGGIRALSIARTVLDIAREHGLRDAVVAGDYALAQRLTTVEELRRVSEECFKFPGIRRARHVITLLDQTSESPLESVSRLVLNRLPFPKPQPQVVIRDRTDLFIGRVDFYWDELGIVGEADGRSKYTDPEVLWREKRRQDELMRTGLIVVRWTAVDLNDPSALLRRLREAEARAMLRAPGERQWRAMT